mmetsp:Transcript_24443/g.37907  ORF Transcript_24443/g.37907 Transcript_24443/m.37907 type:complete len:111 (-) Transcript_24443:291-623(-)
MWSFGCIMGEMIPCTKKYLQEGVNLSERTLFQGRSCYPLSPPGDEEDEENDQLQIIISILGCLLPEDVSFLSSNSVFDYIASLQQGEPQDRVQFDKEFELTDPRLSELVQ